MARAEKKKEGFWDTVKTVFWALVIAMAFRSILYQPFSIPSGSMKPTLLVGDYLFVSKFAYGYSRYSLPFSPNLFDGRIWGSLPERGDVVVFKHPQQDTCSEGPVGMVVRFGQTMLGQPARNPNDCTDYIKRVIGLPGDRIQMIDGVLHVNGQRVGMTRTDNFSEPKGTHGEYLRVSNCANAPVPQGGVCEIEHWIEELPGGTKHSILNLGPTQVDTTGEITVRDGHIFFMGDNRDNSVDSRFASVGQVPVQNLIGRAEVVALSSAGAFWQLWKWRVSRFFKSIV
ncbi:MAG: signal peptidase I [Pseudomonadota bacterium]